MVDFPSFLVDLETFGASQVLVTFGCLQPSLLVEDSLHGKDLPWVAVFCFLMIVWVVLVCPACDFLLVADADEPELPEVLEPVDLVALDLVVEPEDVVLVFVLESEEDLLAELVVLLDPDFFVSTFFPVDLVSVALVLLSLWVLFTTPVCTSTFLSFPVLVFLSVC